MTIPRSLTETPQQRRRRATKGVKVLQSDLERAHRAMVSNLRRISALDEVYRRGALPPEVLDSITWDGLIAALRVCGVRC